MWFGAVILLFVVLFGPLPRMDTFRSFSLGYTLFACGLSVSLSSSWREKRLAEEAYMRWFREETQKCIDTDANDRLLVMVSGLVSAIDTSLLSFVALARLMSTLMSTGTREAYSKLSRLITKEVRQRLERREWVLATADDSRKQLIEQYAFWGEDA